MNRHRNLSFYIESMVLLLFLLAALAVLIRMFGAAQAMGVQARQKTDAALILQTASAAFSAQAEPFEEAVAEAASNGRAQVEFLCDSRGRVDQNGEYRVLTELRAEERENGSMVFGDIEVMETSAAGEVVLGKVETSLYCPEMTGEGQS